MYCVAFQISLYNTDNSEWLITIIHSFLNENINIVIGFFTAETQLILEFLRV